MCQAGKLSVKAEVATTKGGVELLEKQTAEELREDPDRQQESLSAGDPARPVRGEAASGDDRVDVGRVHEILSPGVQDGEKANAGTEVARPAAIVVRVSAVAAKRMP